MSDRHEQGWEEIGRRLGAYEPEGDVDNDFAAFQALRAAGAPAAATGTAGGYLAANWWKWLLGLCLVGAAVFLLLPGTETTAALTVNDEAAELPASPGRSESGDRDENAGMPAGREDTDSPMTASAPASASALAPASASARASSSVSSQTPARTARAGAASSPDPAVEFSDARRSQPADDPDVPATLSGSTVTTTTASEPIGQSPTTGEEGPALSAASAGDPAESPVPAAIGSLPRTSIPFLEGSEPVLPTVIASTSSPETSFRKTSIGRFSIGLGRQFFIGQGQGVLLGNSDYHGFLEYRYPLAAKFDLGLRVGISAYGDGLGNTQVLNEVSFLNPRAELTSFEQSASVQSIYSADVQLLALYHLTKRADLVGGIRGSRMIYSTSIFDNSPAGTDLFSDAARPTLLPYDFGPVVGVSYRFYRRLTLEGTFAPGVVDLTDGVRGSTELRSTAAKLTFKFSL